MILHFDLTKGRKIIRDRIAVRVNCVKYSGRNTICLSSTGECQREETYLMK